MRGAQSQKVSSRLRHIRKNRGTLTTGTRRGGGAGFARSYSGEYGCGVALDWGRGSPL